MTVTMTMEEFEELRLKAKNYEDLVSTARSLMKQSLTPMLNNDCKNYVRWISVEDVEAIVYQFGTQEDA